MKPNQSVKFNKSISTTIESSRKKRMTDELKKRIEKQIDCIPDRLIGDSVVALSNLFIALALLEIADQLKKISVGDQLKKVSLRGSE